MKDIQSGCRAGRREGSVRDLRRYDDVVVHVDTTPSHLVEWLNSPLARVVLESVADKVHFHTSGNKAKRRVVGAASW